MIWFGAASLYSNRAIRDGIRGQVSNSSQILEKLANWMPNHSAGYHSSGSPSECLRNKTVRQKETKRIYYSSIRNAFISFGKFELAPPPAGIFPGYNRHQSVCPRAGRSGAQSQGYKCRHTAGCSCGFHGCVRVGQVIFSVWYAIRRGATPLSRFSRSVRAPSFPPDRYP